MLTARPTRHPTTVERIADPVDDHPMTWPTPQVAPATASPTIVTRDRGRADLPPPEAPDLAAERRHGGDRGDGVRAGERPGEPGNPERGVERQCEADVDRVLEAVEEERRPGVVQ